MKTRRLSSMLFLLALAAVPTDLFAAGPYVYHAVTPCRLIDTRNGAGASTSDDGPIGARTNPGPYDIQAKGFCGVPPSTDPNPATAVTINVTVVSPTQQGDLRIANLDASPFPVVSTLNYLAGEPALANGAIVPLKAGAGNDLRLVFGMVASGNLQILIDVTGYFSN